MTLRVLIRAVVLGMLPGSAWAHSAIEGIGTFYNGVLHPVVVPAHLLLLIVLGLFLARQGPQTSLRALVAFLAANLAGLALAWFALSPQLEEAILAAAAITGVLVAANLTTGVIGCSILAAVAGGLVGMDSEPEGLMGQEKLTLMAGIAIGVSLLCLYATALALLLGKRNWQRVGIRVFGSWVTASSLMVLALSFATR